LHSFRERGRDRPLKGSVQRGVGDHGASH
jgi:hypothetical protein